MTAGRSETVDCGPADPWPSRLLALLIGLFIIAVPTAWVVGSYYQQDLAFTQSFQSNDGWCDPATQGLGVHCFGDFQFPRVLLGESSIWANPSPHPYTPLSMAPHVVAGGLADVGLGVRGSLLVYLIFAAAALLAPALWTAFGSSRQFRNLLPVLIIGVASEPFLMTMDRGNSLAFAVPFLLLFALFLGREPAWVAPTAIVLAASVRPQFILLALGLVAVARLKAAGATIATFVGVTALSFALWPGGMLSNIREWAASVGAFSDSLDVAADVPVNLSASHAVVVLGRAVSNLPGPLGAGGQAMQEFVAAYPTIPGLFLVVLAAVTFFVARGRIPLPVVLVVALALPTLVPTVSFGYYLVFALVLAALILGPGGPGILMGRPTPVNPTGVLAALSAGSDDRALVWWKWAVLIATAASIVPLTFAVSKSHQSWVMENLGLIWLVVCLAALAYIWLSITRFRSTNAPSSA